MPCSPGLCWSSGHSCLLGMTLLLLVCEIITSRLCNSLINMVDSFHTLFIFLHLSFFYLPPHQPPITPPPTPSLSSPSTPSSGSSPRTPVSPNPVPLMTSSPVPSLYPSATGSGPTPPPLPILSAPPSLSRPYGWARVRPLAALVSALLLASLCVSVSVDIVSEALWPHPTEYPLLVTAVGVVGLLFNAAVFTMGHGGLLGLRRGGTCPTTPGMGGSFSGPDDRGEAQVVQSSAAESVKNQVCTPSFSKAVGKTLQDEALIFCNPGASSVLDPDRHSHGIPPPPLGTIPTSHTFVSWSHLKIGFQDSGTPGKRHCGAAESPEDGGHVGLGDAGVRVCPVVPIGTERPVLSRRSRCLPGLMALVQALLGSVLVLTNGLVVLHSAPGCLHLGDCGPLVYLDPGFSALAALVSLATALPQACRYGYLLLQGTPPHLGLEELSQRIAAVPGVLALHDLHVWQLTEAQLVASVHVHCLPGARGCSDLLLAVTEVLRGAGVRYSTVQPEFLPASLAGTGGCPPAEVPPLPAPPHCSLACGTACAQKMCCSPREEGPSLLPSAGELEHVQPEVIIIENTYL